MFRLQDEASEQLTVEQAARNVIAGKYGNGDERIYNIAARGFDYNAVQAMVNEILNNKSASWSKTVDQVAREVIAGKWGNGVERK